MEKKEIFIAKETQNFKCGICKQEVYVVLAQPWTIETDTHIIHSWNYGHQHNTVFSIEKDNEQTVLEDMDL